MIFVTVGTHEQAFDRLMSQINQLSKNQEIPEEIVVQYGFSTIRPKAAICYDILNDQQMKALIKKARVIICHGGPATIMEILSAGKTPIVVPRQHKFAEHVNDHQLLFCRKFNEKYHSFVLVENIQELLPIVKKFEQLSSKYEGFPSNNDVFNQKLISLIEKL